MDFDIPTDLINKTQIGFRTAAGLSNFDRNNNPSPPSTPPLESSIPSSKLNPYVACKCCQGKLLRGLESLICVYCGEYQKKELNPDPISFNSTHGYMWLLQALNFNGSERIGSLAEASGINGGQGPAEDELTLSELLNLKISLENMPVKPENSVNIKTSEDNGPLNADTTDFDNFFTKSTSKSKSGNTSDLHKEQPVASKPDQNKIFEDQENFTTDWNAEFQFADTKLEHEKPVSVGLFEGSEADLDNFFTKSKSKSKNVLDVHEELPVACKSDQNKIFDDQENFTTDWNAEFQFADTKMEHEKPVSVDPFEGAAGDLDSFFTKSKSADVSDVHKEQVVASKSDQESFTSDWNAEFQFADAKSETKNPVSVDPFENFKADLSAHMYAAFGPTETRDFKKPDNASDFSVGPFEDVKADLSAHMDAGFGPAETRDFQKPDNASDFSVDPFEDVKVDLSAHMDWAFGPTETHDFKKPDNTSDPFQVDLFANINNASSQDNPNDSTSDWFDDTKWQKSSANNTGTVKDDNLFDIKPNVNDSVPPEKSNLDNSDWFQSSQWATGGSSSTTNITVNKKDDGDDDDDEFGDWNAFTSSTANQDSVKDSFQDSVEDSWKGSSISEKMSDLNLFESAVDSQELDFGNFLQSEVSTGNRKANANTEAGKNADVTGPKDDVQKLISQMHDLSFMLKDELSVPSKPDDIGTFHS